MMVKIDKATLKTARKLHAVDLSPIEAKLVTLLSAQGVIRGTAQVGYALWPDRAMLSQGAAFAASNVLRRMQKRGFVVCRAGGRGRRGKSYRVTKSGERAVTAVLTATVDPRQLTLFPELSIVHSAARDIASSNSMPTV
jgi:hypothetical protein